MQTENQSLQLAIHSTAIHLIMTGVTIQSQNVAWKLDMMFTQQTQHSDDDSRVQKWNKIESACIHSNANLTDLAN